MFGHQRVVLVDTTHNSTRREYKLATVMVLDDTLGDAKRCKGVPIMYALVSSEEERVLQACVVHVVRVKLRLCLTLTLVAIAGSVPGSSSRESTHDTPMDDHRCSTVEVECREGCVPCAAAQVCA